MPIYEYECLDCGRHHEVMQKITEGPLSTCPQCGGKIKKIISNTSFVLKGTGWYATDYASSSKSAGAPDSEKKPDSTKPEKKQEKEPGTTTKEAVAAK